MGLVEYLLIANTVLIVLLFIYIKTVVSGMEERINRYLYTLEVDDELEKNKRLVFFNLIQ